MRAVFVPEDPNADEYKPSLVLAVGVPPPPHCLDVSHFVSIVYGQSATLKYSFQMTYVQNIHSKRLAFKIYISNNLRLNY
jgi:hypothetical protein